jgi:ligand-binding sensor domain-containing protein
MRKITVFYLLFILLPCAGLPARRIQFRHLNIGDGLSQNTVRCIVQDRVGFMWFGTEDGLNRYDGDRFEVFRPNPDDSTSLSDGYITCLAMDAEYRLWIGTSAGLNVHDPLTGRFHRILSEPGDPYSLKHDSVTAFYLDKSGDFWIGTARGLNRLISTDASSGFSCRFQSVGHLPGDKAGPAGSQVVSITGDAKGRLWIATNRGVSHLDPGSAVFHQGFHEPGGVLDRAQSTVSLIKADRENRLWIGTYHNGLYRCSCDAAGKPGDGAAPVRVYPCNRSDGTGLAGLYVNCIYEDRSGQIWVGTEGGLHRYDPLEDQFSLHRHDPDVPSSLCDNNVGSLYEDKSGILWIGTYAGLSSYYRYQPQFLHYRNDPKNPASLSNDMVWSICEDPSGDPWLATDGGINRFDRKHDRVYHFTHNPDHASSIGTSLIQAVFWDREGRLWAGTNGSGLYRCLYDWSDPYRIRYIRYMPNPEKPGSFGSKYASTLYQDHWNRIWIGTTGDGLFRMVFTEGPKDPFFVRYRHDPDRPESLSSNIILCIYEDRAGSLWIGTEGKGLNRLIEKNPGNSSRDFSASDRFVRYLCDPAVAGSISSNAILSIYEDMAGNLWIGTYGGGLNRFDRNAETFEHFTVRDGLPNDIVYGILEDRSGYLWLSTNRGISKFNPRQKTFQNFDITDGLQDYEFNSGAFYRNATGEFFFGGINGFNIFYPDSIRINSYVPPVVFTEFRIFNESISCGQTVNGRVILDRAISATPEITLTYRENNITIGFAALDYVSPERNEYSSIMEPFEKDWNFIGNRRYSHYARLPSGNYTFRVRGSNSDGNWNQDGASLRLKILPPFWETAWFRILAAVMAVSSIILVYQIRTRAIRMRSKDLEKYVEERTRDLEAANRELQDALNRVQTLSGLLPICASCKKIRDDQGYWHQVEEYIKDHSDVRFSHGLCPSCLKKYDSEIGS